MQCSGEEKGGICRWDWGVSGLSEEGFDVGPVQVVDDDRLYDYLED